MGKNIEKYINLASCDNSPYRNGWTYKNEEAFYSKSEDICYIGEYDLEDLEKMLAKGMDLTDEELIEKEYADNYNSIVRKIVETRFDCKMSAEEIAMHIFQKAGWACISTYILEFEEYNEPK